jgi:hypothetical protein
MRTYENAQFERLFDHGKNLTLESMSFENCTFTGCILSMTNDISRRSTVRNVHLKSCASNGCAVGPAIFEDCSIDGLATNDLLILWGALFKHVTLSGDIGKLKVNQMVDPMKRGPEVQGPFDDFRREYYRSLDWALDISGARFRDEFETRGIPARLFRLDLETQAVITRERALRPGWQEKVSPWNKLWPFVIRLFIGDGDEDMVLAAPLGAPRSKRDELLRGLKELRDLGVAEPM